MAIAALVLAGDPAHASEAARTLSGLERAVGTVEEMVAEAHFRRAIRTAEAAREWADEVPRSKASKRARARLEVLLATARVAIGDRAGARASMGRAVYVWPLLQLGESDTSPRVLELYREVRGGSRRAGTSR